MNPKHDIDADEEDDDFEATHTNLEAYARDGRATQAGLERLKWERKVMRRVRKIEERLGRVEDNQHATVEIAAIVQREIAGTKSFVDTWRDWRKRIVGWAVAATITGLVSWFFATHGVKVQ